MDTTRTERIGELFYDSVTSPFGGKGTLTSLVLQALEDCQEQEKIAVPGRKWSYSFTGESNDTVLELGLVPSARRRLNFDFISLRSVNPETSEQQALLDVVLASCQGTLSAQYDSLRYTDLSATARLQLSDVDATEHARSANQWKVYVEGSGDAEYLRQAIPMERTTVRTWTGWKRQKKEIERPRSVKDLQNDDLTKELLRKAAQIEIKDCSNAERENNEVVEQSVLIQYPRWQISYRSSTGSLPASVYNRFEPFFRLTKEKFSAKTQYRMRAEVRS